MWSKLNESGRNISKKLPQRLYEFDNKIMSSFRVTSKLFCQEFYFKPLSVLYSDLQQTIDDEIRVMVRQHSLESGYWRA